MVAVTYKKAGVDIDKGNEFVKMIKPLMKKLKSEDVLGSIGGFSGFFKIEKKKFKEPVLVASTDGVGTKLLLSKSLKKYSTVGIDLVAMCVNDVIISGARPLFFLDYFATGRLDLKRSLGLMKGIVKGCKQAGCVLLGGETAELPGLYSQGNFDLAGFCVGIVDKKDIIDGSRVKAGDVLMGIQSSGLHSNGFSLVRKIFTKKELAGWLGEIALTPTIIYAKPVARILASVKVKSMAHITGGGFYDNIPRAIPEDVDVIIDRYSWTVPAIFKLIREKANISLKEMFRTFNMGIGLVMILHRKDVERAQRLLEKFRLRSYRIGEAVKGTGRVVI